MKMDNDRNKGLFQKHNERMRLFSQSHNRDLVNRAILRKNVRALPASRIITDTKAPNYLSGTVDCFTLMPVSRVLLLRSQKN